MFGVATVIAGVLAAFLVVERPVVAAVAAAAVVVMATLWRRIDVWRVLVLLLLGSLVATSSTIPALRGLPGALRFVLLVLLAGWSLLQRPNASQPRLRRDKSVWRIVRGVVAFFVLASASALWSATPLHTLAQVGALALTGLCVGLAATRRWRSVRTLVTDLHLLLTMLVILSAVSLIGAIAKLGFAYGYQGRYTGVFLSATSVGMVAALAVPLAWALEGISKRRWPYWAAIGICGAALLVSASRGSIVALVGAGVWMTLRGGSGRMTRAAAAACLVVVAGFFAEQALNLQTPFGAVVEKLTPSEGEDYSTTRLAAWRVTADRWQDQPFLGYGFRQSEHLFKTERATSNFGFSPNTTHNGYLQVLLELGVVGLALFAVTLFYMLRVATRGRSHFQTGVCAAVIVGLLLQFTESPIFGTGSLFPFMFWSLVAACVVLNVRSTAPVGEVGHLVAIG